MKALLARLFGWLLHAYARFCFATSRYAVTAAAERTLRTTWDAGRPTVYVFWHDEFVLLSLNACCSRIQFPSCVTNDSFGGMLVASFWASAGAPVVTIGLGESREARIARTLDALCAGARLVISADYGKPWYEPRPTARQLAAAVDGAVVAMHLEAKVDVSVRRKSWRLRLPLPFNRYALHLSEPMRGEEATSERIARTLWSLRSVESEKSRSRLRRPVSVSR